MSEVFSAGLLVWGQYPPMSSPVLPELPLPFTVPPRPARARHLHLVLPYAALAQDSCQLILRELQLPQLDQLLAQLAPSHVDEGSMDQLIPPHERALAHLWGLDAQSPAWAALAQDTPRPQPCAWMTLCHWTAGADQIRMDDPASLPLDMEDAQTLHTILQPWFAEDGLQLELTSPGRWLVSGEPLQRLESASLDRVLLRDVSHWMPQGPHQRTLQRLHSEVQMLLYNHRFNAERAERGLPPVNAFWLHGVGQLDAEALQAARTLQSVTPVIFVDSLRQSALRQDWPAWKQAWLAAEAGPVAQTLAHVQLGGTATVTFCGEQHVRSFTTQRRSWLQKIKNKISPQRFAGLHEAL